MSKDERIGWRIALPQPPGCQSREAMRIKMSRLLIGVGAMGRRMTCQQLQDAHNIVAGSSETVIEKLRHVKRELNPGYILIYGNEGPMPHEDAMRNIELFGAKVIPALKNDD